jgi:hypothetical protein
MIKTTILLFTIGTTLAQYFPDPEENITPIARHSPISRTYKAKITNKLTGKVQKGTFSLREFGDQSTHIDIILTIFDEDTFPIGGKRIKAQFKNYPNIKMSTDTHPELKAPLEIESFKTGSYKGKTDFAENGKLRFGSASPSLRAVDFIQPGFRMIDGKQFDYEVSELEDVSARKKLVCTLCIFAFSIIFPLTAYARSSFDADIIPASLMAGIFVASIFSLKISLQYSTIMNASLFVGLFYLLFSLYELVLWAMSGEREKVSSAKVIVSFVVSLVLGFIFGGLHHRLYPFVGVWIMILCFVDHSFYQGLFVKAISWRLIFAVPFSIFVAFDYYSFTTLFMHRVNTKDFIFWGYIVGFMTLAVILFGVFGKAGKRKYNNVSDNGEEGIDLARKE